MPRSRKEKRQHSDSAPEQRARVIKSGMYDGSNSSRDFVVSGHSTGSANSEMEAMSHQVSIDAGRVPDYSVDDYTANTRDRDFDLTSSFDGADFDEESAMTAAAPAKWSGSLTKKIVRGSLIGAGVGAVGYLAYRVYEGYRLRAAAEPTFESL